FSSRRRHTGWPRDWSSDVCSSDLAGAYSKGLLETEERDWDAIMDVGLRGVFLCCKRAVQQMLRQEPVAEARGRIINLSSQHGMRSEERRVGIDVRRGGATSE